MAQEPRTAQERALELIRATLATPGWLPTSEAGRLVWAIRCAIVLGVLVLIASAVNKTLWDWLELLIVPVVLAIGGYLFNSAQNRATQGAAEERARDEALQAYLDQMSQLLTDKDRSLHRSRHADSLSSMARARTLTVLPMLDGVRKRHVLQFLYESGLISKDRCVLDLKGADLAQANLEGASLEGANLYRAKLSGADLSGATVTEEQLTECKFLEGATMPDGSKHP